MPLNVAGVSGSASSLGCAHVTGGSLYRLPTCVSAAECRALPGFPRRQVNRFLRPEPEHGLRWWCRYGKPTCRLAACTAQCEVANRKEAVMKYGMRKPSWKKSLSARTKGRATRAVKKALIPGYGKKGMGWLHPKRKLYNAIYKKTTFSLFDLFK